MIKLLGMTGRAGSGKDTAAGMLSDMLGFETYALASPIKNLVNSLFGWGYDHSEGSLKEQELAVTFSSVGFGLFKHSWNEYNLELHTGEKPVPAALGILNTLGLNHTDTFGEVIGFISPRKAYQLVGTEWGRSFKDTLWLDIASDGLRTRAESDDSWEHGSIKRGTIITDIRFPNERDWLESMNGKLVHLDRGGYTRTEETSHSSEAGLEVGEDDWVLYNKGSLSDLRESVADIASAVEEG